MTTRPHLTRARDRLFGVVAWRCSGHGIERWGSTKLEAYIAWLASVRAQSVLLT